MEEKGKRYYLFELDDYSCVSCTSGTKIYFGTVDEFARLLQGLKKEHHLEMIEAFEKFLKGDRTVQHTVCYNPHRLAIPATIIGQKTLKYNTYSFRYKNPYGFYYLCKADFTKIDGFLIKSQQKYYCCYRMRMKNPHFVDDIDKREFFVDKPFWGFPNMISIKKEREVRYFENVLLQVEKAFKGEKEAREYLDNIKKLNLTSFFEDIFGDG